MIDLRNILFYNFIILIQVYGVINYGYEVKVTKFELNPTENNAIDLSHLKLTKIGKKRVFNGKVIINDLPDDMKVSITISRKIGPTYMEQPYCSFKDMDSCEAFFKDPFMVPAIVNSSNIPYKCPIPKGVYEIINLSTTPSNLPKFVPQGDWRALIEWRWNNETIYSLAALASIESSY